MTKHPDVIGDYPGPPQAFIVQLPERPRAASTGYWVGWRPAEVWEAVVVKRAYARLAAEDAELVRVAGREPVAGFVPSFRGDNLAMALVNR